MMIVAEIGASHRGHPDNALELIRTCVQADAIKFQLWTEPMAVEHRLKSGPWENWDLRDLYTVAETKKEWLPDLFDSCRVRDLVPFCSPFDLGAVDFLEDLDCPMYKIASFELVDLQLVEYVAMTRKPIIISTGQADRHEIRAAVNTVRKWNDDLTLLHCVSQYPASLGDVNLITMKALKRHFECKVGISDHTEGSVVPIVAASMGADMIEKHVCLDNRGLDSGFAMLPRQFNEMAIQARHAREVMGKIKFGGDFELRRSLYFSQDLPAGTVINRSHIKTARPNKGLSPLQIEKILGRELTEDVWTDQPVKITYVQ